MKKLTKSQMKMIMGGGEEAQEPGGDGGDCDGCKLFCYTIPGDEWGRGKCPTGSPTTCKNYCCENGQPTRWC